MPDNRIFVQALELSKKIQECLKNEFEAGRLPEAQVEFVKFKPDFDYQAAEIGVRESGYFDKKILTAKYELITSFKRLTEHTNLLETAKSIVDPARVSATNLLHVFEYQVTRDILRSIENQTSCEEDVKNTIGIWIGDLLGEPLHWDVSAWIRGVRIKDDIGEKIAEIGHGLSIRRPNSSDFAYGMPVDDQPRFAPNIDDILNNVPDAVLRLSVTSVRGAGAYEQVKNRIRQLLTYLLLYKLGSVYTIRVEAVPQSFMTPIGIPRLAPFRKVTRRPYYVGQYEATQINKFIDQIEKWLSTVTEKRSAKTEIEIAIERYCDATLAKESVASVEHSIASAVMCLEALYSQEPDELKYRMSLRVSTVLRHYAFDPQVACKVLKCAYDIRSKYAHGRQLSEKEKAEYKPCGSTHKMSAEKIASNVLEYSRISILTYLAVAHSTNVAKKGFVDRIDRAIVSARGDETISNAAILVSAITTIREPNPLN
jgi:hypothetical protein